MTERFSFSLHATDGAARLGTIHTPRGEIRTPAFMPVGTAATVKAMRCALRYALARVDRLGGLHKFMNWEKPILTDSGGFQVMSLAELRKLTEDGVTFRSHIDGSKHTLTPERSMEIQRLLGSDIVMCFDECPALPADRDRIAESMRLSMRWAKRSREAFGARPGHMLFGIQRMVDHLVVQGVGRSNQHEVVIMSRHVKSGPDCVVLGTRTGNGFSFLFPTWPEAANDLCRRWREMHRSAMIPG